MKIGKIYRGTISFTEGENLREELLFHISLLLSNRTKYWKRKHGLNITVPEGTLMYRIAIIKVPSVTENINQMVEDVLKECKAIGVEYSISKTKKYTITLTNTLVGNRVQYFTVDIKGCGYKIRTVILDLKPGEVLEYGVNMYPTKDEAELAAEKMMVFMKELRYGTVTSDELMKKLFPEHAKIVTETANTLMYTVNKV